MPPILSQTLRQTTMTAHSERRRRRGTPISAGFAADLQTLGTLLGSHTRGLDAYLQRQASRVEQRYQGILADAEGFLLPPDLNLDAMSAGELQALCRSRRLRGWSKLRRDELLAFVKGELGHELELMRQLHKESLPEAGAAEAAAAAAAEAAAAPQTDRPDPMAWAADASRSERLLLLLLQHLNVPQEQIQAAWQDCDES
jgi:hypothetical protein